MNRAGLRLAIQNYIQSKFVGSQKRKQIITETTKYAPKVFNKLGEPMHYFYLQDDICSHNPYSFASPEYSVTQHILWDRFNKALPIQFYSHNQIFFPQSTGIKKFGLLIESEAIVPSDYENVYMQPDFIEEYDGIFTHSYKLLERYSKARFMPGGGVWYGSIFGGGTFDNALIDKKSKNVSLVASNKISCELHNYRKHLAEHYKQFKLVDTYGTFDGGSGIKIADSLTDYRYSIVIENMISPYYFTEKIMNCFASMTIPIYIGATDIGKFFNTEGIIQISPMDFADVDLVLSKCCKEDYCERRLAILDNFERVQKYICYEDFLFNEYSDFILK